MANQFLIKETMAAMRGLSAAEITALQNGTYEGVQLLGYYQKGDTPAPIEYYLSSVSLADNGGSVIQIEDIKLEHIFISTVDIKYFGAISNDISKATLNTEVITKILALDLQVIVSDVFHVVAKQNNTEVVNVRLKGVNTNSKLVIDNTNSFPLINCSFNQSNILIEDLNFSTVGTSTVKIFEKIGDIKVSDFVVLGSKFDGNIQLTNINGQDNLLSLMYNIRFINNTIMNSNDNFARIISIPYNSFIIQNNSVRNHSEVPFYLSTNNYTNADAITKKKINLEVNNNNMVNDDSVIKTSLAKGAYHCFVLVEGHSIKYFNNKVSNLKSNVLCSVYDVYCFCNEVEYYSNENVNNLCLVSNTLNSFFKLKAGAKAKCYDNIFTTDETYIDRMVSQYSISKTDCSTRHFTASATGEPSDIEYYNNTLHAYYIDNNIANSYIIRNAKVENNTIVCNLYKGTLLPVSNLLTSNSSMKMLSLSGNKLNIISKHENGNSLVQGTVNATPSTYVPNCVVTVKDNTLINISGVIISGGMKITTLNISGNNIRSGGDRAFRYIDNLVITDQFLGEGDKVSIEGADALEYPGSNSISNATFSTMLTFKGYNNNSGFGLIINNDITVSKSYYRTLYYESLGNVVNISPFVETYVDSGACKIRYKDYTTGVSYDILYGAVLGNSSAYHLIFNKNGLNVFLRVRSNGTVVLGYFSSNTDFKIKITDNVK